MFKSLKGLNNFITKSNNYNSVSVKSITKGKHSVKSLLKQVNTGVKSLTNKNITISEHVVINLIYFPKMYTLGNSELIENYLHNPNLFMGNKI